jgi:hypothetical protein
MTTDAGRDGTGARLPAPSPMGGGPIHVPSLNDSEYEALLTDLRLWVAGFVSRFALDVRTIPPCWERHNAMVETLAALRDAERGCFVDRPPPSAGLEWIRAVRDTVVYMRDQAAMTRCTAHEHRDPMSPLTS